MIGVRRVRVEYVLPFNAVLTKLQLILLRYMERQRYLTVGLDLEVGIQPIT